MAVEQIPEASGRWWRQRRDSSRSVVYSVWALIAVGWLLLDQGSKALAVRALEGRPPIDLGLFALRLVRNPGGAFGIPGLFPGLFVLVTVVVVVLVLRALPHTDRLSLLLAYGLVTGGALGNVVDRILRDPGFPSGRVVDFIDLGWWPVFNLADSGIVVGALLIALLLAKQERDEPVLVKAETADADP
ncbi:MAG: signal peptidase II [Egibacteraceae bacterium]